MCGQANCFELRWRIVGSHDRKSSSRFGRCARSSSRTQSSKTSPTHSGSRRTAAAIDPDRGTIKKRVVLDSAEIAATKELVTLRTSADRSRLYVANGSDESATILSLPN